MVRLRHGCPAHFLLVQAHDIDSYTENTFPDVIYRGANVMRHHPSVLEQVMERLPWGHFDALVATHRTDERHRGFSTRDHLISLLAGTLCGQQGLRATVTALAPNDGLLRLLGGTAPARSTLAEATRYRSADVFIDLLNLVLRSAEKRRERTDLREVVRLIDGTYIQASSRMKSWLGTYKEKVALKLHFVHDPRADQPVFFAVTPARINDITAAKELLPIEPGVTYVFDRGYYDFRWWSCLHEANCRFVTRLKLNTPLHNVERRAIEPGTNIIADETAELPGRTAASRQNPFPYRGRLVTVRLDTGKELRLFTNDLDSPAVDIAALYRERWQIELFFRWIKQNLRITRFIGTSENAVRIQVAVAMIAYVLVRMVLNAQPRTYTAVQVLRVIQTHLWIRKAIERLLDPPTCQVKNVAAPQPQMKFEWAYT